MGAVPAERSDDQDVEHWTEAAAEWIAWARRPDHDSFWAYRNALRAFIGPGTGTALDVGCGEGRVARELVALGYDVVAIDPVAAMVKAAAEVRSARAYALASAHHMPFAKASFDLVVAYNVLMDVVDVGAALHEIARVLRPSGRLIVSIVHPFSDRGRFAGDGADAPFELQGSYFGRARFEGEESRDGLRMRFAGWSQPLESYAGELEAAGLAITTIREPLPDLGDGRGRMARWSRIPLFLWMIARPIQAPQENHGRAA